MKYEVVYWMFYFIFVVHPYVFRMFMLMYKKLYVITAIVLSLCVATTDVVGACRQAVTPEDNGSDMTRVSPPPLSIDSALTPAIPFTPLAVSMYGYAKRLSDARETFVLRNETGRYRISRVLVRLVYSTQDGEPFHTREELVECDLMPGASRMVSLKSFDTAKTYYYYMYPPVRAKGIPYMVRYDVLRYDVVVE